MSKEIKVQNFSLPTELAKRLKIYAVHQGTSASAIASEAIKQFLDQAEISTTEIVAKPKKSKTGVAA